MAKQKNTTKIRIETGKETADIHVDKSRSVSEIFNKLRHLVGNTPLLEIRFKYKNKDRVLYAKAEYLNFTGSIKDRMALHILKRAYENGSLHPGDCIAEATSGNTGIAFSALGRCLGHPVIIFMPDWMSRERIELIKSLGAEIRLVTRKQGGFIGSIHMTEELAQCKPNIFLPCQFSNEANTEAHEITTGPEIWWQLASQKLQPDAFIAGVGTGGTVMGVGRFFKRMNPRIKIYPLEPAESPTLSTGCKVGTHRIQGISDEFIPSIVQLNKLDDVVCVNDGDAILAAQKISAQLGLAIGISSGANFIGALKIQNLLGADKTIVTVFADDNKKYLSTDLMQQEPVKNDYLSPAIEFTSMRALKRDCHVCCDGDDCFQRQLHDRVNS